MGAEKEGSSAGGDAAEASQVKALSDAQVPSAVEASEGRLHHPDAVVDFPLGRWETSSRTHSIWIR